MRILKDNKRENGEDKIFEEKIFAKRFPKTDLNKKKKKRTEQRCSVKLKQDTYKKDQI